MAYLGLAYLFFTRSRMPFRGTWQIALVAAAFGTLTASFNAIDPYQHWLVGAQILFFLAIGPASLHTLVLNYPRMRVVVLGSLLSGQTISALVSAAQSLGLVRVDITAPAGRASGLAGHPNILGLMAGLAICISLYLLMDSKRHKGIFRFVLGINIVALLLSGSVSALIASTLGILVLFYVYRVKIRKSLAYVVGFTLCILFYLKIAGHKPNVGNPLDRMQQVTGRTDRIGTWDVRLDVYVYALQKIAENPIVGLGLDNSSGLLFHRLDGEVLTHNILLRAWLQGGLFMLVAFFVMYLSCIRLIKLSRLNRINGIPCAMLVTVLSFALTSAAFQQTYFWLLIFVAWSLLENKRRIRHPSTSLSGKKLPNGLLMTQPKQHTHT